jgi:DNA-binding NarL/FixJ family response regulator
MARAVALEDEIGRPSLSIGPRSLLAKHLLWAGELAEAARLLEEMGFANPGAFPVLPDAVEEFERAAPGRAAGELTEAEHSVAELVAQGMKNREIGRALHMSVASVEAHLTRIYRKLEIRSRSELARLVADGSITLSPK